MSYIPPEEPQFSLPDWLANDFRLTDTYGRGNSVRVPREATEPMLVVPIGCPTPDGTSVQPHFVAPSDATDNYLYPSGWLFETPHRSTNTFYGFVSNVGQPSVVGTGSSRCSASFLVDTTDGGREPPYVVLYKRLFSRMNDFNDPESGFFRQLFINNKSNSAALAQVNGLPYLDYNGGVKKRKSVRQVLFQCLVYAMNEEHVWADDPRKRVMMLTGNSSRDALLSHPRNVQDPETKKWYRAEPEPGLLYMPREGAEPGSWPFIVGDIFDPNYPGYMLLGYKSLLNQQNITNIFEYQAIAGKFSWTEMFSDPIYMQIAWGNFKPGNEYLASQYRPKPSKQEQASMFVPWDDVVHRMTAREQVELLEKVLEPRVIMAGLVGTEYEYLISDNVKNAMLNPSPMVAGGIPAATPHMAQQQAFTPPVAPPAPAMPPMQVTAPAPQPATPPPAVPAPPVSQPAVSAQPTQVPPVQPPVQSPVQPPAQPQGQFNQPSVAPQPAAPAMPPQGHTQAPTPPVPTAGGTAPVQRPGGDDIDNVLNQLKQEAAGEPGPPIADDDIPF